MPSSIAEVEAKMIRVFDGQIDIEVVWKHQQLIPVEN